jgi:hypothetical protein
MQVPFATPLHVGPIDLAVFAGLPALLGMCTACWDARRAVSRELGLRPLIWCALVSYPAVVAVRAVRGFEDVWGIALLAPILFLTMGFLPALVAYNATYAVLRRRGLARPASHEDPETDEDRASTSRRTLD